MITKNKAIPLGIACLVSYILGILTPWVVPALKPNKIAQNQEITALPVRQILDSKNEVLHLQAKFEIVSLEWSPNGQFLATGNTDNSVDLWEGQTGRKIHHLLLPPARADLERSPQAEPAPSLVQVTWSPDSKTLASSNSDTVHLWNASTGELRRMIHPSQPHIFPISLAWKPNSQTLATGSFSTVQLWDASSGMLKTTLFPETTASPTSESTRPQGTISTLSWSPKGEQLAIAGEDRHIYRWDATQNQPLPRIMAGQGWIYDLAWSPDGKQWAVNGELIALRTWDVATGKPLKTLSGFEGQISSMSWHPNHQQLTIGTRTGDVEQWNAISGQWQSRVGQHQGQVNQLAWSPNGKILASSSTAYLKLWTQP